MPGRLENQKTVKAWVLFVQTKSRIQAPGVPNGRAVIVSTVRRRANLSVTDAKISGTHPTGAARFACCNI